ncbi:lipopolysaccharide biosynthesis protein [Cellulophaga baltica]|uniref:Lipopolysaccharide biosynthesis protein n=1 Tax=Cellulophaga baltica 18 TaxID=1348584 RepID=A0AAU8RYH3_9FLAO|nr:lipopolysaccharide biosynthesis protein [Cellulophaga baltica]AIZ42299.1 hypothetical protein M666_12315 [Cellulophaga baltica 18]
MSLGKKMFHGIAWNGIERLSTQLIQFIIGIILARLLTPKEYGILGILLVFILISNVFIDSGFTKALIQKQDRNDNDISTVFIFNFLISLLFYCILWFTSPYIAIFYDIESLSLLLKILAISLITNALFAVPSTLITIDLNFKLLAKINFTSSVFSGIIAIILAYMGYGIWSLVYQTLIRSTTTLILMWFSLKWKPNWRFSSKSLKSLFSFGSKLLVASLLNVAVNNLYALFIAKVISTKDLGYYTRGTQFSDVAYNSITSVLDNVLLSGLSTIQDNKELLIKYMRSILKTTTMLVMPIFLFLAIMAEPIIKILLTEKWLSAVPIMQFFCLARLVTIISGINVNLLYVIGRTDLALKQQYIKITVRIIFFIISLKYGIIYIAMAELLSTIIHFFINTYYPGKFMQYGAFAQLKDMKYIILSGIVMSLFTLTTLYITNNILVQIAIAPIIAIVAYFISLKIFKIDELNILVLKVKEIFKK